MNIDWNSLLEKIGWGTAITIVAFIIIIILRLLLDFKLALFVVKYFSWIPVRTFFRDNPIKLAGDWEIIWGAGGSKIFENPIDRHGHPTIKQFGRYIYAEFYSQRVKYSLFWKIQQEDYIVGDWFDAKNNRGYFGVFQLKVINDDLLKGVWLGHSKSTKEIRNDELILKRTEKK